MLDRCDSQLRHRPMAEHGFRVAITLNLGHMRIHQKRKVPGSTVRATTQYVDRPTIYWYKFSYVNLRQPGYIMR